MAVGVLLVCRAAAKLEADKAYNVGAGIGEVVDGISGDGHTAEKCTHKEFAAEKQDVADYSYNAGEIAVGSADFLTFKIIFVFDKHIYK